MIRRRVCVYAAFPIALALTVIGAGPMVALRATSWLVAEVVIAIAIAVVLGVAATLVAGPKTRPYLNQIVSRGVELAAALPVILLCAIVTTTAALPVPLAVAVVVGVLGGLRCTRMVASSTSLVPRSRRYGLQLSSVFRNVKRRVSPLLPAILEQVVGLEAALAWMGLFDRAWTGGWGERLGHAASQGQSADLAWWTFSTAALVLGLKVLLWQSQSPEAKA